MYRGNSVTYHQNPEVAVPPGPEAKAHCAYMEPNLASTQIESHVVFLLAFRHHFLHVLLRNECARARKKRKNFKMASRRRRRDDFSSITHRDALLFGRRASLLRRERLDFLSVAHIHRDALRSSRKRRRTESRTFALIVLVLRFRRHAVFRRLLRYNTSYYGGKESRLYGNSNLLPLMNK